MAAKPAILAFENDLMLGSFVREVGSRAGFDVFLALDSAEFLRLAAEHPARLVVLNLNHPDMHLAELAAVLAGASVIAYGRHTEPEPLRSAREAGYRVLARSAFVEEFPGLLAELNSRPAAS
ncbi:MAG TPA: hypothetical protein VFB90_02955 [Dehalococcoidia bacterium]|nr:hypothetical protein [Dehalococcoidia bacterium]